MFATNRGPVGGRGTEERFAGNRNSSGNEPVAINPTADKSVGPTPRKPGCNFWPFSYSRAGCLISQTSETWQPRPLPPRPFSACQVRSSVAARVALGQVEFQRLHVARFQQVRVDLERFAGDQPHLRLEHVAGVDDAQLVRGGRIEPGVVHAKRLVEERAGMPAPRSPPVGSWSKAVWARAGTPGLWRRVIPSPGAAVGAGRPGRRKNRPGRDSSSSRSRRARAAAPLRSSSLRIAANRVLSQSRLLQRRSTVSSVAPRPTAIAL